MFEDPEFRELMGAGRENGGYVPDRKMAARDVKEAWDRCHKKVAKLLKVRCIRFCLCLHAD